jgi:uncharacterized protein YjbI with pentapeptide repeats
MTEVLDWRAVPAPIEPQAPRHEEPETLAALPPGGELADARLVDATKTSDGFVARGLKLTDVAVERGNLANLAADELALRRVTFTGSRLTGAQWTRGTLTDVVFRGCRIDLATFGGTTFERVAFEDCLLMQTDFRDALWRAVRLERCDLTEADFGGLRIARAELRGCTLDGAVGVDRLRGAALPWGDIVGHAGLFAGALGIKLLEDDERR